MSMPRYNPYDSYDTSKDSKTQQLTDSQRLDKLEKEVCCLRTDFDRIKWEQAVTEAAIGRAIIRGSASLGRSLLIPQEQNDQDKDKNLKLENSLMDPTNNSKLLKSQLTSGKPYSSNETTEKLRKNEKDDGGYFTLG